jgi:hypothetical protein
MRVRVSRAIRRLRRDGDRGSAAAAVLIFALVFMALAAFVVDGGLSISRRERAADIAEQAARFAAQDIDIEKLRNSPKGTPPEIIAGDCTARVREFAAQSDMSQADIDGSYCTFADTQRVVVSVQLTYRPILTGYFYDHEVTVHGTAAAESLTGPAN